MPKMGTANARKNRGVIEDHNAARWLEARFIWPAWYVVRICKCHYGECVTYPLDSQEQAERVLAVMVENSFDQIKSAALIAEAIERGAQ